MDISVVIPVFNDLEGLSLCVGGLTAQEFDRDRFEVIVVDNGPDDGAERRLAQITELLTQFPNASALHEPRSGSYAARNHALDVASGRVLAFTDADCIPEPGWLAAGLRYLDEHPEVAAAGGPVKLFPKDPEARTGAELYDLRHGFQVKNYITNGFYGVTANLFTRRTILDQVGPFDASLKSGGDKEWGTRLKRHGLTLRYLPEAPVRHPARPSVDELRAKAKRVVSGDVMLRRRQGWSRLNWLRYTLQPLRPPVRTIWRARHDPLFQSRSDLLRYSGVFILVRWMTTFYRLNALRFWRAIPRSQELLPAASAAAAEARGPATATVDSEPPTP